MTHYDPNHGRPARTRRELLVHLAASLAAGVVPSVASRAQASANPNAVIRTVLEDMSPDALAGGATLFHEHLSLGADFIPKALALLRAEGNTLIPQGELAGPPHDLAWMVDEVRAARDAGVACLVDAGHADMGRDLPFLKRLSAQSGMPIVASAGYYAEPFYPRRLAAASVEEIARELVRQARVHPIGAFGEIGTWHDMSALERKVFRAVALAHQDTNLPIFTHTDYGRGALEQLDLMESAGVNPSRLAIGHLGGLTDESAAVSIAICKRGAYVGYDRQGGDDDAKQVPAILRLLDAGFENRLLFSSDFALDRDLRRKGGSGYGKTVSVFLPTLRRAGVHDDVLQRITVDNPRRFLAFMPKFAHRG